jgi:hypothetical protein
VVLLTSHGFSSTVAHETEPATLARTTYHVLAAWIGLAIGRVRAAGAAMEASRQPVRPGRSTGPAVRDPASEPSGKPTAT